MKKLSLKEVYLKELSYRASDVPGFFWLAMNVDKYSKGEQVKQLTTGNLKGLKGISGNKEIVLNWFGIGRNALLVMPGDKVIRLNKLSRILYNKPEYLISKNFAALYRIWDKHPSQGYGKQGMMQNLVDYMIKPLKSEGFTPAGKMGEDIRYGYLSASKFGFEFKDNTPNIETIKDLVEWFQKAAFRLAKEEGTSIVENVQQVSFQDWKKAILKALETVGQIYQDEGEWVVKNDEFVIPKNSKLLILKPDIITREIIEKVRQEGAQEVLENLPLGDPIRSVGKDFFHNLEIIFQHNLDKIYKISFVKRKKFDDVRIKLKTKKYEQQ